MAEAFVPVSKEMFGAAALSPGAISDSSSRSYMFFTQMGNSVSIKDPDVPYILSGLEKEFRDMNYHIKLDFNFTIIYILPYYEKDIDKETASIEDATFVNVVYFNEDDKEIGFIKITRFDKKDKKFGFTHNWKDVVYNMEEGDTLRPTDFTTTNAEKEGIFAFGKNVNILYSSEAEVAEDAFVMSSKFVNMFEMDMFKTITTSSDVKQIPLNLRGDADNYIPFPKVGETVGAGGIVMAMRKYNDGDILSNFSYNDLRHVNYTHDKLYKIEVPFAKVVDINIMHNPDGKVSNMFDGAHDELVDYANNKKQFDIMFISKCREYIEQTHCDVENDLYVELVRLQKFYHVKVKKLVKRVRLPTFSIEITLKYSKAANIGFKFTTTHGSKGIGSVIVPEESMPIDANGIRADLMIVVNSNIHRMNIGNLTDGYKGAAIHVLNRNFKSIISSASGTLKERVTNNLPALSGLYIDFMDLVNPNVAVELRKANKQEVISMYMYMYKTQVSFPIPLDVKDLNGTVMGRGVLTERVRNSKFAIRVEPIVITNIKGEKELTVKPAHMHVQYVFALNKIADDGLVVSSAKLNPLGIPVAPPTSLKDGMVYNEKPTKISETETRFYASYADPRCLAEIRDRSLSIDTKHHIAKQLLDLECPTNINMIVDRKKFPYGGDVVLKTINGLLRSMGMKLKGVKK